MGSGRHFLHQRSVLLGGLVHLLHGFTHLCHTVGLLFTGTADGGDDAVDLLDGLHHFHHGLAGLVGQRIAFAYASDAGFNQLFDLLGRLRAAACQRTHLTGHHGKATALLTGTCGLDRSVQRQDIGLEGNAINHANDVGNLAAAFVNAVHGLHHALDHLTALHSHFAGGIRLLAGFACVVGVVAHGGAELFHGGRRFLQRAGLVFRAAGQVQIGLCNLGAGRGHAVCTAAHLRHHGAQTGTHLLLGIEQLVHFIRAHWYVSAAQIALGHCLRQLHRMLQRHEHGAHKQGCQGNRGRKGQAHHHQQHDQLVAVLARLCLQLIAQQLRALHRDLVDGVNGTGQAVKKLGGGQCQAAGFDEFLIGQLQAAGGQAGHVLGRRRQRIAIACIGLHAALQ